MISSRILWKYQKIIAVVGIPLIIVVVILALTICNPMTVVPQGTVLSISPQHHVQYGFTRPPHSEGATYGQFSADNGATLIVMTAAQFSYFKSTGSLSSAQTEFIYSTGQVSSGELNAAGGSYSHAYVKPRGQYYFVFFDAGSQTTTVTITRTLQVESC